MTDMTATEIAAAVAELTKAIKEKGYLKPTAYFACEINSQNPEKANWSGAVTYIVNGGREGMPDLYALWFDTPQDALSAAWREVAKLPDITLEHQQATEDFRAALAAARDAGVDVGKIVGAGE